MIISGSFIILLPLPPVLNFIEVYHCMFCYFCADDGGALIPGQFAFTAALNAINAQLAPLAVLPGQVAALQGQLVLLQGQVGVLQGQVGALQVQIDTIQGQLVSIHNASASQQSHTLVIPRNLTNQPLPAWVPRTLGDLRGMSGAKATSLMQYYNLSLVPLTNSIANRRKAIAEHLGVRF